jgi:hypothetical protein
MHARISSRFSPTASPNPFIILLALTSRGRPAVRRIAVCLFERLTLETFERELLGQEDISLDKAAHRPETPFVYALAITAQLFDVDLAGILDEITVARIASRHLEASERIELGALRRAEMRAQ